jgi:quinol monooxygenase YgiN
MLTIVIHMTVKAGREDECEATCKHVMMSTRSEDEGCLNYTFYRRRDNPRELMLFEQWRDADSVKAHLARLYRVFGHPDDTEPYPPTHHRRQISKAFLDLFEKTEAVRYDALG